MLSLKRIIAYFPNVDLLNSKKQVGSLSCISEEGCLFQILFPTTCNPPLETRQMTTNLLM